MSDDLFSPINEDETPGAVAPAFDGIEPVNAPVATVLVGGPGFTPGRAVGRLLASSPFPMAYVNREDLLALGGAGRRGEPGDVLEEAIAHAQRNKLPLIVDDEAIGASPDDQLAAFKRAGFGTRLVVTVPREIDAAMTIVTQRLQRQVASVREPTATRPAASWRQVVEMLRSVPRETVDRVSVFDGDGEVAYEGPVRAATWDAVRTALRAPLRGSQGVLWLGELRRVTDYVANSGAPVTDEDCERVLSLYDLAERRVLPELPIPDHSRSAVMQRAVLRDGRAAIRGVMQRIDHTSSGPHLSSPTAPAPEL